MNPVHLDEVVQRIERAFGEELPLTDHSLGEVDAAVLQRVIRHPAYRAYLQDQVNRQIIRDYLVNAVMLGCISDESLCALSGVAGSFSGRSQLSLHMLMKSVQAANEIPRELDSEGLKALRPVPGSPPHMVIVGS